MLRLAIRAPLVAAIAIAFLAAARGCREPAARIANASRACRRLARLLGWRLHLHGHLPAAGAPRLVVMNHLSWVDPLLLATRWPLRFVTSREVQTSGLAGRIATAAGCLFVERRSPRAAGQDRDSVAAHLAAGPVAVFPEATSTAGDGVLPFRPALFQSAIDAGAAVQPLCIRYRSAGGRPLAGRRRDLVHYHGRMHLLPHVTRLLTVSGLEAELWACPPLPWQAHADRRRLAVTAHGRIARRYLSMQRSGEPPA